MDDLTINIFTGNVNIKNFTVLEQNDKDNFFTFNQLNVNVSLLKLISKQLQFTEITLDSPNVVIVQNGDRFNFTDIIEHFTSKEDTTKKEEKSTWTFDLQNITLINGAVSYHDVLVNSRFNMKELALAIPQIYFSNEKTDIGVNLKFADGGDLTLKLLYAIETSGYNLHIQMNQFSLSGVEPYLKQFLNINSFRGKLTTNLVIKGKMEHIFDITAKGDITLSDLSATTLENKPLASIRNLTIEIDSIDIQHNLFHFNEITTTGLNFTYDAFKDGNTIDQLLASTESTDAATPADTTAQNAESSDTHAPFDFKIAQLSVKQSSITYNDHTLRQALSIPVNQIDIDVANFTFNESMDVKLNAVVGTSGQLKANWTGNLANLKNQKLNVLLRNFQMPNVSAYCVEYLAYPIKEGVLSFASSNTLENNLIKSNNKIDIYNCKVDKKLKNIPCEYDIPLRTALYILTDRKGKITFDLPVSGDINSPDFSYRKIIFKTLGDLLVKVIAAPFDLIAEAIGGTPDIFADIEYPIHPQGLGSESYDRLNKVAEAMKAKPDLTLTLQQSMDKEENMEEYAIFNTKKAYYQFKNNKPNIEPSDFQNIANIKNSDSEFVAYVESRLNDTISGGNLASKCLSLYEPALLGQQIMNNIERRNTMIINQLTTQGIPTHRLMVLPLGDKKVPQGKTILSFGINADE